MMIKPESIIKLIVTVMTHYNRTTYTLLRARDYLDGVEVTDNLIKTLRYDAKLKLKEIVFVLNDRCDADQVKYILYNKRTTVRKTDKPVNLKTPLKLI